MNQLAQTVLMVRPAAFQFNEETAVSNEYQQKPSLSKDELLKTVRAEFDEFVEILQANGIEVIVYNDTVPPEKPDAIFPNNWISMHEDGKLVIYPMKTPNRRMEKQTAIVDLIKSKFKLSEVKDFSYFENDNKAMEGTGSMIFDHENRLVYACLSPRTDLEALKEIADYLNYKPVTFKAFTRNGQEQYHTNVVLCISQSFVVICDACITNKTERQRVLGELEKSGREIISISREQQEKYFAANMLGLRNEQGHEFLVMSEQAMKSLSEKQLDQICSYADILAPTISTIESVGGGSARCMLAEIFCKSNKIL